MPVDFYPNKTAEELLTLLESLQDRGTKGAIIFTTGAGIQTQRGFQGSARTEVEIKRVLYSLHLRDPITYGDNPYKARVRRTRARYTYTG